MIITSSFLFIESSGGGGETRETTVARVVNGILEKFPEFYNPYEVMGRLKEMGLINPMVIFLRQEIDRMQKVSFLIKFIDILHTNISHLLLDLIFSQVLVE